MPDEALIDSLTDKTSAPEQTGDPSPSPDGGGVDNPANEPEKTGAPDTFKIKVDGVEMEVGRDELIKLAQKGKAADKRFEEAAEIRKKAENLEEVEARVKKALMEGDQEAAQWLLDRYKAAEAAVKESQTMDATPSNETKADIPEQGLPQWEVQRRINDLNAQYDEEIEALKRDLPADAHSLIEDIAFGPEGASREKALAKAVEASGLTIEKWSDVKARTVAKEAAKKIRERVEKGLKAVGSTHLGRSPASSGVTPPRQPQMPKMTGNAAKDAEAAKAARAAHLKWVLDGGVGTETGVR